MRLTCLCWTGLTAATLLLMNHRPADAAPPPPVTYRVLVSTDLGGDPDDIQSLFRLLHYSDVLKLEGIVSSPGPGAKNDAELIKQWIRRVDVDHLRARGHTALMAEADALGLVRQGQKRPGAPAADRRTPGSDWIIRCARAADPEGRGRPLWVLVWGSLTDVAQALHDDPEIAPLIRLYVIGSSNTTTDPASRDFVFQGMQTRWPKLWWIENGVLPRRAHDTFRGVYLGGDQAGQWGNAEFVRRNIRGRGTTHGGLFPEKCGDAFPLATSPSGTLKEGDTPSMLYLLSPVCGGTGDVNDPTQESWGGRFRRPDPVKHPNYYADLDAGAEACQATISRWRVDFLRHWKERWAWYATEQAAAPPGTAPASYRPLIRSHFDRVIQNGVDAYGADRSGLWLASIDIHRGGQPDRPDPQVKRTYRQIHAPRGSNLYWDQPALVAAYNFSRLEGDPRYQAAADRYVRDFLNRCVSPHNGLFLWGNHLYYDVFTDKIVSFSGGYHEIRPLPCAWQLFWNVAPDKTERSIRTIGVQHVKDAATGLFCRHASVTATTAPNGGDKSTHPFLEAGGVIVESLCWLYAQTGRQDHALTERALRVARFSFDHRGAETGLLQNQPGPEKRWDYYASTTEAGLWAGCLLRSADSSGNGDFRRMARDAVAAYLRYGYDEATGRFYGQLNVTDGTPRAPDRTDKAGEATIYQPGQYADLWEPLFPTHNYPMCMAEACLTLYEQTNEEQFKQAALRWAKFIAQSTPAGGGQGAYADQYGRCIHFLTRAGRSLNDPALIEQARGLAAEAVRQLYDPAAGMFRSHPGEDRCDAVDGIGILFLALLALETGTEPDLLGWGW